MWRGVGRNGLILGSGAVLMALLQAAFRLLAIGEISVPAYGRVGLLISVFNAVALAGMAGVPVATARLAARGDSPTDGGLLRAALTATAIPCVLASFGVGIVAAAVTGHASDGVLAGLGMPPLVLSAVGASYLQGKGRIWAAASVQPINTVAQLAFLAAFVVAGVHISVGVVMACFYLGNLAAMLAAAGFVWLWLDPAVRSPGPEAEEVRPRRILTFSLWLSVATLAVFLLPVACRVALVHLSYRDVAFFDLALLVYSIAERLAASLVTALIPIAATEQRDHRRVVIPSRRDVFLATGIVVIAAVALWETHAIRAVLDAVGLHRYASSERLLVILLAAVPAELLYMINAGLLSAFGQTRRLAFMTCGVLGLSLPLLVGAAMLGAPYLAGVLVVDYWALYLVSSALLPAEAIRRERLYGRAFGAARTEQAPI